MSQNRRKVVCPAVLLIAGLAATSAARAELVAHWKLDDNAANTTVTEEVGAVNGTMTVDTNVASDSGADGTSLDFADGRSVNIDSPDALLGLTEFTVSAWVRDYSDNASEMVLTWSDGTFNNRIQCELHQNSMTSYFQGAGGRSDVGSALTWDAGTWYHVAWTHTDGTMVMYRDGVQVGGPFAGRPSPSDLPLNTVQIGGLVPGGYNFMGDIDDVQVYDVALNAEQVAWLAGHPGAVIPEPGILSLLAIGAGCFAFWRRRRLT